MADHIYLHLWLESFNASSMLESWGKLLEAFPASTAQPGVRGIAIIPFSWGETAVVEQLFAEGVTIESTLEAAREFQHEDYAYQAAMRWDVWRQKTLEEIAESNPEVLEDDGLNDPEDELGIVNARGESFGDFEATDQLDSLSGNETPGWKRVPMEVTLTCVGPEFDAADVATVVPFSISEPNAGNPHFKIELGLDTLFLPDSDLDPGDEDEWEESALCYRDNIVQLLGFLRRLDKVISLKSRLLWSAEGDDLGERIRQAYAGS